MTTIYSDNINIWRKIKTSLPNIQGFLSLNLIGKSWQKNNTVYYCVNLEDKSITKKTITKKQETFKKQKKTENIIYLPSDSIKSQSVDNAVHASKDEQGPFLPIPFSSLFKHDSPISIFNSEKLFVYFFIMFIIFIVIFSLGYTPNEIKEKIIQTEDISENNTQEKPRTRTIRIMTGAGVKIYEKIPNDEEKPIFIGQIQIGEIVTQLESSVVNNKTWLKIKRQKYLQVGWVSKSYTKIINYNSRFDEYIALAKRRLLIESSFGDLVDLSLFLERESQQATPYKAASILSFYHLCALQKSLRKKAEPVERGHWISENNNNGFLEKTDNITRVKKSLFSNVNKIYLSEFKTGFGSITSESCNLI